MNIFQVVSRVDEEASGPSYSVPRLCESIASLKHDVTLLTLRGRRKSREFESVKHLQFPTQVLLDKLGVSRALSVWLRDEVKTANIVHSHGLWMMPNVYPINQAQAQGVSSIVSPRGTLSKVALSYSPRVKAIFWQLFQKQALLRATAFHATSEDEYLDIRRAGFLQPVAVIPNGIDVWHAGAYDKPKNPVMISLGRLHPKKGLEMAIEVWARIQHKFPDWSFRIIGKGELSYVKSLQQLVDDSGATNITIEGPVYGSEKNAVFKAASLFVLPTRNENFGMVVAEALAMGVPAIVTEGAPWRGLESNKCGWWIKRTEASLTEAMVFGMTRSKEELTVMGRAGQNWMADEFGWPSIAERMVSFYSWLNKEGEMPSFVHVE